MTATILFSGRDENNVEIKFIKNQEFINLLIKVIGKFHINWDIQDEIFRTNKEPSLNGINDIEDEHYQYKDEYLEINIFVGHYKVIFIMKSSENLQQQFFAEIDGNSEWKIKQ